MTTSPRYQLGITPSVFTHIYGTPWQNPSFPLLLMRELYPGNSVELFLESVSLKALLQVMKALEADPL